ncbi:MAG: thioredoxin family protein [Chloroflexi bacterium]|nr:thioredoxin family protein [Chloroflexota bacterium]
MATQQRSVSPEKFRTGMTFDEYVKYIGTPENLKREGSGGVARKDFSEFMRQSYQTNRLNENQAAALKWIASQPNPPVKVLVVSEEWSSDCRRDVPMFAQVAEALGAELRIFPRDGAKMDQPDGEDIMAGFMNEKNEQSYRSIPVAVFYDQDMNELYRFVEYADIYHKDKVAGKIRNPQPQPGETKEQTAERGGRNFLELQASPIFKVWACAGADQIISALHERIVLSS